MTSTDPALHHDDDERGQSAASRANLKPFRKGDPASIAAARKGAETRRRNAETRKAQLRGPVETMQALSVTFGREELGPMAVASALWMMGEVAAGRQRVRDPAAWVRVLVDVARLESGDVTSRTAHIDVSADDVRRAVLLRDAARSVLPTYAVEVTPTDDEP